MIKNDRQLGAPFGLFSDTKANIEALTGLTGGEIAYATDTGEDGSYDAIADEWVWGRNGGGGSVDSVNGQTGVVSLYADDIPNAPTGNISSTDVQGAINELDSEKAAKASPSITPGTYTKVTVNGDGIVIGATTLSVSDLPNADGWLPLTVQPTRTGADDPTYTIQFASADYRGYLAEGTPIKWTQNSIVRYGYVSSAPVYSGGNTTITVLTRTDSSSADYDVLDTGTHAITGFAYALPRQPGAGFPALPEYWDVLFTDTGDRSVSTPGTAIVNPNSMSVTVPIGDWEIVLNWITWVAYSGTNTRWSVSGGLGTTNSSFESDLRYYFLATSTDLIANGGYDVSAHRHLTAKQTYYINTQTGTSGATSIRIRGDISTTKVRARCRYL